MRILVISDIHANLSALDAVLEDAGEFEAVWCLGDLVGYGPDPNDCIRRIRGLPGLLCLIGNHDQAALGNIPLSRFNSDARQVVAWTMEALNEESRTYLRSLPSQILTPPFTLAHGSPRQPVWEYVLDYHTADRNFDILETDYCLIGHSHLPLVFVRLPGEEHSASLGVPWDAPLTLAPQMMINPGSVGQPRDMDPRAAYALLDTEALTWEARRVSYDVAGVQLRILQAGLPERQALRLIAGW